MIPIGDINPRERTPYVTYALLAINIAVYLILAGTRELEAAVWRFGITPDDPWGVGLLTHMFLHGGGLHLAGNMLFLWIFGDNVEDRFGPLVFTVFYLGVGIAAAFCHILSVDPDVVVTTTLTAGEIPMIGASGAISGVVGAYVAMFPKANVRVFVWWFFPILLVPAWVFGAVWLGFQLLYSGAAESGVAWWAHIGGAVLGYAAGLIALAVRGGPLVGRRGEDLPRSIREASRVGGGGAVRAPVFSIDERDLPEAIIPPTDADSFAVLLAADEEAHYPAAARAAAAVTGEAIADVQRRLLATRGVAARGLPRHDAVDLQFRLRGDRIPAHVVRDDPSTSPPPALLARSARWSHTHVEFRTEAGDLTIPWSRPFLYVAAAVGDSEIIDVFLSPRRRIRIVDSSEAMRQHPGTDRWQRCALRDFAADAIRHRQAAVVNPGIRVLSGGGRWGYLRFASIADYDRYIFWLLNLLLLQKVRLYR